MSCPRNEPAHGWVVARVNTEYSAFPTTYSVQSFVALNIRQPRLLSHSSVILYDERSLPAPAAILAVFLYTSARILL